MKLSQADSRDNIALDLKVLGISTAGCSAYSLILDQDSDGIPYWLSFVDNQEKK